MKIKLISQSVSLRKIWYTVHKKEYAQWCPETQSWDVDYERMYREIVQIFEYYEEFLETYHQRQCLHEEQIPPYLWNKKIMYPNGDYSVFRPVWVEDCLHRECKLGIRIPKRFYCACLKDSCICTSSALAEIDDGLCQPGMTCKEYYGEIIKQLRFSERQTYRWDEKERHKIQERVLQFWERFEEEYFSATNTRPQTADDIIQWWTRQNHLFLVYFDHLQKHGQFPCLDKMS